MHQIQWHDVRGDRGNEPYDYSSKWKPVSTEKVREIIARHNGPQSVPILLKLLAAGDEIGFPTFAIRRDPASVVQVVAVPAKPVKSKDPGAAAYSEDFLYALRKAKEIQEKIHKWQGQTKLGERLLIISNPTLKVPADA